MKVVVVGGTGRLGSQVVAELQRRGQNAVPAAPSTGFDTISGAGVAKGLTGAQVVVDVSNSPSFEDAAVLQFFQTSTGTLLAAERKVGTRHHVMLSIVGALNLVYGIAAIGDSQFYVRDVKYVIGDLKTWGWFLTVLGAVQLVTAIGVFRASEAARWLGIGFAAANMIVQFLVLPAAPVWAIMVFFVDVIIIFGLLTYGGRDRHNLA